MGSGDFRLFGAEARSEAADRWVELVLAEGFSGVFHSRQVHGNRILLHDQVPSGLSPGPDADGHASRQPGAFMAVTVADCVPVFLVDPHRRSTAVLHAGWRGIAAGILEEGIDLLTNQLGSRAEDLLIHLGPAICGTCYEVGPEVHVDLDQPDPGCPTPLDLRAVLTARALGRGLMHACLTRSSFCSLCGGSPFFSHRGGATQRQVGFMGVRTNPDPP
jgi:YfiH family protein